MPDMPKMVPQQDPEKFTGKSDTFSPEEQKSIVKMVIQDIEADEKVREEWLKRKKVALQHKNGAKPSEIEGIKKKSWQSDRNLGVAAAISDTYHSTLFSTCWNPDSLHFVATNANSINNKDNLERFMKVIVGKNHANVTPEIDDFVQNKIDLGFSMFEIYRSVTYDWVDRTIPNKTGGFDTKTEKIRIEKGVMENVANVDDILIPRWGSKIQDLSHIIRIVHFLGDDIVSFGKEGQFINVDAKMVLKFQLSADKRKDGIELTRAENLGLDDVVDEEFRAQPIDVYKWYGWWTKDGRREKYRFYVERKTETLLSGKPLRTITKNGKYPFVGGPFEKIPGQLKGKDIFILIEDPINALNEVYNQKADFQYVTNCPFGFHKATEGYTQNTYDLEPGVSYPSDGNPSEEHYFPNLQRSMAWAEQDIRILFEVIEKRTGAATYFQTNERNASGTATRDMIVSKQSETRFGKWVSRIQEEICEGLTMLANIYQEHVPDNLGDRILGDEGDKLFRNLSIESLRYDADARMEPDLVAGSKAYERQVALWAADFMTKTVWMDPRINPKGNWLLTFDTMKKQGIANPERYLPPEPKPELGATKDIGDIWQRLVNGEVVEVEPNWNIPNVLAGMYKKMETDLHKIDEEYRPNLEKLMFDLEVGMQQFVKKIMEDQMASRMAQQAMGLGGQQQPPAPQQQQQPQQGMM